MSFSPTYQNVHNRFKWNGFSMNRDDLFRMAYNLIKEGSEYEHAIGLFLLDWFDQHPTIAVRTSGTTGQPKDILVDKQAMVHSALSTGDFFALSPGDRVLHCLPAQYIAGKMMLVRALILGLEMDVIPPSSQPLANIDERYEFAAMVPLQAESSLDRLSQISKIIIGGAPISKSLAEKLLQVPSSIFETYGMTETITHIAAKKIGEPDFTVLPGVTISQDDEGCLVISAPRISDQIIATRDLVRLTTENQFVFLGRRDNVINSGGIKVIPELIESTLSDKIRAEFFISGMPDELLGEKVALLIEGEEHPIPDAWFEKLGRYEKPREIIFVPKFERTTSGKVKRAETLARAVSER